MIDITSATPTASATATVCENMALYGAAPERGERDTRIVWDEDDATGCAERGHPRHRGRRHRRRHPDGRRARAADVGPGQHAALPGHPPRPRRRPHRARDEGPPDRTGRLGGEGARARDAGRQGAEPRRPPRRLREDARPRRRRLPRRDRRHCGARVNGSHVEQDRRSSPPPPSTPATSGAPARTARPARTCPRAPWSPSPAARPSPMPTRCGAPSTRRTRSTATWSCSTAAAPASRRSRQAGPRPEASTRSSAARTGTHTARPRPSAATTTC